MCALVPARKCENTSVCAIRYFHLPLELSWKGLGRGGFRSVSEKT